MLYPAYDRQYDPGASRPEQFKHSLIIIILKVDSSTIMLPAFNLRLRWAPARVARAARSIGTSQSHPSAINPSQAEVNSGQLTPQNLEVAIRSLFHDGLVVVTDVVPHELLDQLNKKMIDDAQKLYSRKENSPFNYNPNNLQQDPPPTKKYFDPQIFLSNIRHTTQIDTPAKSSIRSNCNSNHIRSTGSPSKMDVLLRKHSHAPNSRKSTHISTGTLRR